ncbi:SusC/RagA family TonB-linked outer membrane protein [Chryseobacterium sp. MDT2-18]|uniref:SusC/RagA family TonB-linked outer membrane protein n=1 Tax=Chryseobacterium sp. MDT2-18 TaxID=1259136 RepID=UPI002782CC6A|nr:SusC/RagA family TonB-linked outer membrane protein [Chryseobacterium sp. MDT2-18]MDQ0477092.1 TonB-linked SusC/RagA family outer membrane protein [Chryseobacterium sp. MDT2-18]
MKKILSTIGLVSGCLAFSAIHSQVQAQTRTVTGTVNNGEKPISGVVVTQEGSSQMTTTTETGAFSLQITGENPILIFRHPEYGERKISTDGKTSFIISLTEKVKSIEEVVLNAGYYNVKAKESTGSISKVTAKDIENQPVNNVLSAVQGRMAGVNIIQGGGTAGGGYEVQIRGKNSLRTLLNNAIDGNQPLYVLDGVPMLPTPNSPFSTLILPLNNSNPLNSINPNDIESIEVLKDADATAIYGSRGANGVLLITTKKGNKNRSALSLQTSLGFSTTASQLKMMDTKDYLNMRRQAFLNDGITAYPATAYDLNGIWDPTRYTDWQKILTGSTATTSTISLGLSGGSEQWTYRVNATHHGQTTVFPADYGYKNNTLTTGFTHRSADKKLQLSLNSHFSQQDNTVINEDFTNLALTLSPNAPALYMADGSLNWENNTFTNPVASTVSTYLNASKQFNNSINLGYQLIPHFRFDLNAGFNYQNSEEFSLRPHTRFNPAYNLTSSTSSSTYTSSQNSFSYLLEPQLNYDYQRGTHHWTVLVGGSFQSSDSKQSALQGSGFENNSLMMNINAAKTKTFSDINSTQYRYAAVFGRFNYQWHNRYILNLTARRDGSSRFGPNNRFANFGAVGAAWLFSKERWLEHSSLLNFGKLRASYGKTGSDNIGDSQYRDTYSVASSSIYNGVVGLVPSRLYNPDFSWETTKKLEIALELGLWQNRIQLNAAHYRNRSSNQLVGLPLPAITGFTSVQANLDATVENRGWELELQTVPVKSKDFTWQSDFNVTVPKNTLLAFPNLQGSAYANQLEIGYSTSIVKLFEFNGIDPATGLYRFTDVNGDGKITAPDDNKNIAELSVKYYGGWSNKIRFQNWDLSFLFQFTKQNNYNYNSQMSLPGTMINQPFEVNNVWSATNPTGYYMPYSTGTNAVKNMSHYNFTKSTAAVSDASYIRLKNVQVNYKIPLRSSVIKEATVYLQGQNVWTLTNYFGLDPEFIVTGYLPPLKTWSLGTQINF